MNSFRVEAVLVPRFSCLRKPLGVTLRVQMALPEPWKGNLGEYVQQEARMYRGGGELKGCVSEWGSCGVWLGSGSAP